jgi:hypothetical protein
LAAGATCRGGSIHVAVGATDNGSNHDFDVAAACSADIETASGAVAAWSDPAAARALVGVDLDSIPRPRPFGMVWGSRSPPCRSAFSNRPEIARGDSEALNPAKNKGYGVELTRIDRDWTQSRPGDERNIGFAHANTVELTRIELVTSCMPCKRSPN